MSNDIIVELVLCIVMFESGRTHSWCGELGNQSHNQNQKEVHWVSPRGAGSNLVYGIVIWIRIRAVGIG